MTEKTWRNPTRKWPQRIRSHEKLTEDDEFTLAYIGHDWYPPNWHIDPQEDDKEKCEEVERRFKTYFTNYLTNH